MAKIYLGIGHGGADFGAVAGKYYEKDLALSIGKACAAELRRHGVEVLLSRESDQDQTIAAKVAESNSFHADFSADIHINAGGGNGAEIYHTVNGGKGKILATAVLGALGEIGQNSRGCKTKTRSDGKDYFAFIRNTDAPAVIIECGFIDHKEDLAWMDTKEEQIIIGKAIAKGFLKTLGIPYQEEKAKVIYADASEIPSWAKKAVEYVTEKGYMVGDGKRFRPNDPITRAEVAAILARLG